MSLPDKSNPARFTAWRCAGCGWPGPEADEVHDCDGAAEPVDVVTVDALRDVAIRTDNGYEYCALCRARQHVSGRPVRHRDDCLLATEHASTGGGDA